MEKSTQPQAAVLGCAPITPTFYDHFKQYNAESEGDIDIIKSKNSSRPDVKYLKWMRGWQEVLKVDPTATYDVLCNADGNPLHRVGTGGMVHVRVTIQGHPKEEWYPVESMPMQSILYDNITPSQTNKAIKRALTKCLALFGLASNLYLNENMTEDEKDSLSADIVDLITGASTRDELIAAYTANKDIIDHTPRLLRQFQAKGKELQCNRITK